MAVVQHRNPTSNQNGTDVTEVESLETALGLIVPKNLPPAFQDNASSPDINVETELGKAHRRDCLMSQLIIPEFSFEEEIVIQSCALGDLNKSPDVNADAVVSNPLGIKFNSLSVDDDAAQS